MGGLPERSCERTTHLCKKGHKLADAAALVEAKGGEVLGGAEEGGGGGGGLCDGQQRDGKDLHGGGGGGSGVQNSDSGNLIT